MFGGGNTKESPIKSKEVDYDRISDVLAQSTGMSGYFLKAVELQQDREMRYRDYDKMVEDPRVAGALELMSDDSVQYSKAKKAVAWVDTSKKEIKEEVEELFMRLQLNDNLWDWAFLTAQYGDFFLQIYADEQRGIYAVGDDLYPGDVERFDINGLLMGFRFAGETMNRHNAEVLMKPWDFVHFRISGTQKRSRLLRQSSLFRNIDGDNKYRMTTKYGMSLIEAPRYVYKILHIGELSLGLARVARAGLQRVIKTPVGKTEPKKWPEIIKQVRSLFQEDESMKVKSGTGEDGDYASLYAPLQFAQDIFLPVPDDGRFDLKVDDLTQDVDIKGIVDLEYWRDMLFAGLKTPKAFLGYEGDLPGGIGQSALLRMDIRYARTVKRLFRAIVVSLKRLVMIHLAWKGIKFNEDDFEIVMDFCSTAEEEERKNVLNSALDSVEKVQALLQNLGVEYDKEKFIEMVFQELLQDTGIDYSKLVVRVPEEGKEETLESLVRTKKVQESEVVKAFESVLIKEERRALVEQPFADTRQILPKATGEQKNVYEKIEAVLEKELAKQVETEKEKKK